MYAYMHTQVADSVRYHAEGSKRPPPDFQRTTAALAEAVRETTFKNFRALIMYNANPDIWPENRCVVMAGSW
jgi:hypothetical protein